MRLRLLTPLALVALTAGTADAGLFRRGKCTAPATCQTGQCQPATAFPTPAAPATIAPVVTLPAGSACANGACPAPTVVRRGVFR